VDDSAAKRSVEEGGIGYRAGCTTMEGVCEEILEWNREHEGVGNGEVVAGEGQVGKMAKAAMAAKGAAA
jgi:hypothetical protein